MKVAFRLIIRDADGRHADTGDAIKLSRGVIPTAGDLFVRRISASGGSVELEAYHVLYRVFKDNQAAIVVQQVAISDDLVEALALS
jgi:hypothetical protein